MWRRARYWILLVTLCAAATCPAAKRTCDQRAHSREAETSLDYLEFALRGLAAKGQWISASVPLTPAKGACCDTGGICGQDQDRWTHPTWQALGFTLDRAHYYSYEVQVQGETVTLRATADLDCNGVFGTFERQLTRTPTGLKVTTKLENQYE